MKESRLLKVYDPQRPKFFRDLPFTLTAKQVEYILTERPAAVLVAASLFFIKNLEILRLVYTL